MATNGLDSREGAGMSSKDVPTPRGRKEPYAFQGYVVGLIDILGQTQRMLDLPEPSKDGWDREQLLRALHPSLGSMLRMREAVDGYLAGTGQRDEARRADAPPRVREIMKRIESGEVTVFHFSDMSLISAPVVQEDADLDITSVMHVLSCCCMAMLYGLAHGIPVRGGVSIGTAAHVKSGEIWGPALAKAHRLERCTAEYPRIVVDAELVGLILAEQEWSADSDVNECLQALGSLARNLVTKDGDGQWIVHWLGDQVRGCLDGSDATQLATNAAQTAKQQLDDARRRQDQKLVPRYEKLCAYMGPHLPAWGVHLSLTGET